MTFPSGTTITSGFINVPTNPNIAGAVVGYGTWTPSQPSGCPCKPVASVLGFTTVPRHEMP
jgi:hypothetical protein